MSEHCPNGGWHYEDMSCCHSLLPDHVAVNLVTLLTDMRANDYPNGNEWAVFQDRIDATLAELPESVNPTEVGGGEHTGVIGQRKVVCSCGWESDGVGLARDALRDWRRHREAMTG
jgi:hypothetical protein